ncbi:hypothetical protein EDB86DRAFT_2826900 [Lactarius hatsudake]|nr:hypothetical protein EDB86DRAFT_2826900 [Lactarius hatsudake]
MFDALISTSVAFDDLVRIVGSLQYEAKGPNKELSAGLYDIHAKVITFELSTHERSPVCNDQEFDFMGDILESHHGYPIAQVHNVASERDERVDRGKTIVAVVRKCVDPRHAAHVDVANPGMLSHSLPDSEREGIDVTIQPSDPTKTEQMRRMITEAKRMILLVRYRSKLAGIINIGAGKEETDSHLQDVSHEIEVLIVAGRGYVHGCSVQRQLFVRPLGFILQAADNADQVVESDRGGDESVEHDMAPDIINHSRVLESSQAGDINGSGTALCARYTRVLGFLYTAMT